MRGALLGVLVMWTVLQAPPARTPVVVELFTSEGCSSCPTADALLSKLAHDQPVVGAEIIPLELHVTYWDDQGWKDPASLHDATERQRDYARHFGTDDIYTPQAVVDGRAQVIGSDEDAVRRAVASAAKQPHVDMSVDATVRGGGGNAVITVGPLPANVKEPVHGYVFITEDGITSAVGRGENSGRTLHHDAVVRQLSMMNYIPRQGRTTVQFERLPGQPARDRLHMVAILQGEKSGHIWGAAAAPFK